MKKIALKNIFFDDVAGLFDSTITKVSAELNEEQLKKLKDKIGEVIEKFDDQILDFYLKHNSFSLEDFLISHGKNQGIIIEENRDSFSQFIFYVNCCHVVYEKTCAEADGKHISNTLKLVVSLYGMLVRRSEQIVSLLIDGYIDGAMIIWRSLYENAIVVLTLLKENDEELAKKFRQHSFKNAKKKVVSFSNKQKELKFKPLPKRTDERLLKWEKELKEKYGKDFVENEYGWADHLFPSNQKANLRSLEERVGMKRFRPYYLLCSEHSHLGFNALDRFSDGNRVILPRIIAQETEPKAFIDPMQFTLAILHEVNNKFLEEISVAHEYSINFQFLDRIFRGLLGSFVKPGG